MNETDCRSLLNVRSTAPRTWTWLVGRPLSGVAHRHVMVLPLLLCRRLVGVLVGPYGVNELLALENADQAVPLKARTLIVCAALPVWICTLAISRYQSQNSSQMNW